MTTVGFSGYFSITNWTLYVMNEFEGRIVTNQAPEQVTFESDLFAFNDFYMRIRVPSNGSISFTNTSPNGDGLFLYAINSTFNITMGGTTEVNVLANDTFEWFAQSNSGSLDVVVSNFIFTPYIPSTTTVINLEVPAKIFGEAPFEITSTSNSPAPISYSSSNVLVATVTGDIITIVGPGTTTITAIQEEADGFTSGTATTTFQVAPCTSATPAVINTSNGLVYFMTTSATYGNVTASLEISSPLITSSRKDLTGENVTITRV